ncbi:nucleotidyltransferase family protein [Lysobacter enzymogenes]|uniref:nucleotidyltransferase family protein n=1 Tax=Lysobacter enzymogenes TaxID=69 RepID=UPI00089C69A3|nr:nucleotidyltransferase family protein [Lysobacter enzymogenes]SDW11557.1 molybdenum cofactor cytidylyltransferase [Lysobacter enzymogenes]
MEFAAVLLAAGASRRLGRPKQLLRRDGETLLRRGARLALASGAARTLVVLGARADALRGELDGLAVEAVLNPDWQDGMAASLAAAARALAGFDGAVLVLACDQPALELAHLHALRDGAAAAGCAATEHAGALGVPVLIAPALWRDATDLRGDRGFGAALAQAPDGAVWRLRAPELELDLDTPGDVDAAIARGWLDPA